MKRDKTVQIVLNRLGVTEQKKLLKLLKQKGNYFSIILDESTDVSISKSLVVITRFWDDAKMEVRDFVLSLIEVQNSTAQSLFDNVKNVLNKNFVPYDNLIAFGVDNANVMLGDRQQYQKL